MSPLSNLEVLIFVLGLQGGTLQQVCTALGIGRGKPDCVPESVILDADHEEMNRLCRLAQTYRRSQ